MFLAAVTAAISLASVELKAVIDCALDWYTMAPPQCVIAYPVVDLLLEGLFPYAASTKQITFASFVSDGYCGRGFSDRGIAGIEVV